MKGTEHIWEIGNGETCITVNRADQTITIQRVKGRVVLAPGDKVRPEHIDETRAPLILKFTCEAGLAALRSSLEQVDQ